MSPSTLIETAVHTAKPYTAHVISGGFSKRKFSEAATVESLL